MKLILLYGPPAVGKLTIAKILTEKTNYKLLHNHLLVNPLAEIFSFDTPTTRLLTREFRLRIFEEAIKNNINIIATFGIAGNNAFGHIDDIISTAEKNNGELCLVQLTADKQTLLERVENASRKKHGKTLTKEKLENILKENLDMLNKYPKIEHLTINTDEQDSSDAAKAIIKYYNLVE